MDISYKCRKIVGNTGKKATGFMDKRFRYGVYCIVCTRIKAVFVGRSRNLSGRLKNHRSLLRNGRHPVKKFQEDWDVFLDDFEFVEEELGDVGLLVAAEESKVRHYLSLGYMVYNLAEEKVEDNSYVVVCGNRKHCSVLERTNGLLLSGRLSIEQLESSLEYMENIS
jgi:hypothetical protein